MKENYLPPPEEICTKCGKPTGSPHLEDTLCSKCEEELLGRTCECCGGEMSYHPGKICPTCKYYEDF